MSIVYATSADYTDEYGTPAPSNVTVLLKSASRLVRAATRCDVYDVDDAGKPTDTVTLAAFVEATIVQAHAWVTLGIDPATGGLQTSGSVISSESKSLDGGSKSTTYDNSLNTSVAAFQTRQDLITDLTPEALQVLQDAKLATTRAGSFG